MAGFVGKYVISQAIATSECQDNDATEGFNGGATSPSILLPAIYLAARASPQGEHHSS